MHDDGSRLLGATSVKVVSKAIDESIVILRCSYAAFSSMSSSVGMGSGRRSASTLM